jgi:HD-GYP domain-containing protein (c-di-GMP phosphodiesterase class II)
MKYRISLPTRIFLLAFATVLLVSGAGSWTLNKALRQNIRERVKESLESSGELADNVARDSRTRTNRMLSVVTENAGLKAAVGLLRELPPQQANSPLVRRTIEENLFALNKDLEFDLLILNDYQGNTVAGLQRSQLGTVPINPLPSAFVPQALMEFDQTLYEATTVPINLSSENLGSLTVASVFSDKLSSPTEKFVLLDSYRVFRSTFPAEAVLGFQDVLRKNCWETNQGCEIELDDGSYLAFPLKRSGWSSDIRLFGFQRLDTAISDITRDFSGIFFWIGFSGLICSALISSLGARSISKPITDLTQKLQTSKSAGKLATDFPTNSAVDDVNLLATALNDAGQALGESQKLLNQTNLEFLESMARALDARDPYTAGHSDRVSANSTAIARAMGLPANEVEVIRIGAKMHDIGKIGIPDKILQKPGRLDGDEMALIKLHPQIGKRILEKVAAFNDYLPIVELHHENYDGSGYPYGLSGEEVPFGVRIVHVADVYDAISSNRSYRTAMPAEKVREIMLDGKGTQFDPVIVDVFMDLVANRSKLEDLLAEVQEVPWPERILQA